MSESKVLVIIVTYNKKEYVSNLLKSLRLIDYKNYDVVVVDNASTDGTSEHIAEVYPAAKIIRNAENMGGSGGFNTGLSYAFEREGYDYYWLLDNDVEVSADALSILVRTLDGDKEIAVAGSQMCQLDNPGVTNEVGAYVDFHRGCLVLNRHLTRKNNNSTGVFDVDYVAAASMLVRAEAARQAGLWENFFIHFDDVDWCLRFKSMGHRVVAVADSVIWHLSAAEKPITWARYYDVRNMLFLLDKHASRKDVARFGRRKALQAVYFELKGLTPIAELILDAVEDFFRGQKGKKAFPLPQNVSNDMLRQSHPRKDAFVYQNEYFDLKSFPFEDKFKDSFKGIMVPSHLIDAEFYWRRNGIPLKRYGKLSKLFLLIVGLAGYRSYTRAYIDIRGLSFIPAFLSNELAVKINETNWLLNRDRLTVWRNISNTAGRSLKYYVKFFF